MRKLMDALLQGAPKTGLANVQYHAYHDTVKIGAGVQAGTVETFVQGVNTPNGGVWAAGNKTIADTNFEGSGRMPDKQRFIIGAFRFIVRSMNKQTSAADLNWLMSTLTFEFWLKGRPVFGPVLAILFGAGAGLTGFAATTTAAENLTAVNNGSPSPRDVNSFADNPIILEPGDPFKLVLNWSAAIPFGTTNNVFLQPVMEGVLAKEI